MKKENHPTFPDKIYFTILNKIITRYNSFLNNKCYNIFLVCLYSQECFWMKVSKERQVTAREKNNVFYPVNIGRYLDVDSTFFERHGRRMDVKTTLSAQKNLLTQDIILTSIQESFNLFIILQVWIKTNIPLRYPLRWSVMNYWNAYTRTIKLHRIAVFIIGSSLILTYFIKLIK